MATAIKAIILTISDSASRNEREDISGPTIATALQAIGAEVMAIEILPDERARIAEKLCYYADHTTANLIVTTGGTGLAPRDVTPEATRDVIEREAPGLAELMRAESLKITPLAALSRAVCGTRKDTLIINLPGSVRGAKENLAAVSPLLSHAITLLGKKSDHN
ncbi:MAG TPA: MogA/MoaB family molybdenum cofactor biosynthesis protein [Blastocatellia bacterium]|nr:MogA/MoaB family molybdenum cofactor biosynthesis protein [Blastocatellia bacterium]